MGQLGRFDHRVPDTLGNAISGASVTLYREGATVVSGTGTSPLTVTVRHRGKIAAADTVFINTTTGTTYSVDSVTATTVVISGFAGTLTLTSGDRIIPSNSQPTLYGDDQGGATTSNPLTTSATGRANCWMEFGAYDVIVSGGGATTTAFTSQVAPTHTPGQTRYADEFGSIQLAINDLPSTGGTVRLSGNTTYTITTAITVPDDVELVGGGYSTIIKKNVGTAMGCIVNSGANTLGTGTQNNRIVIRNMKIIGEATATTNYAIRMENVDNFRIENVWCQDILTGDSAAIDIDSCQHFFVRGCYVNNCTNNGIKVRCQAEDSTDFVIADNIVDTTASQNGIFVANSATNSGKRFTITGNTVKSAGDVGIEIGNTGATAHSGFTVSGNAVISATGDGILIRNANSGTVNGNVVSLGGNAASAGGIQVFASAVDSTDIAIFGNTVAGRTAGCGVRTALSSTFRPRRLSISGNTLRGAVGADDGISVQGFLEDSTISNNVISSWPGQGIELTGSTASVTNCNVSNNVIGDCTSHAISLTDVDDSVFTGNCFFGNGTNDINWSGSSNTGNVVRNNHGGDGNSVQAITAVGNTIVVVGSTIELTADASYTLTSTPTIADGFDQQEIVLINVDAGADVITLQDQGGLAGSNLRLSAATIALAPRDSIILRYNATIGDWIQVGQTNVT